MSSTERTAYRTCPLCEATCGLELTVVDGAVTRTEHFKHRVRETDLESFFWEMVRGGG